MRVTNSLIADTVVSNLFKNTEQLFRVQEMIASGKQINRPSDDPVGMVKVLDCRKTISSIEQYERNIAHGKSWLSLSDSSLGSIDTLLIRAKELAVSQATETATAETREIAAEDVKNIFDQILQQANTKSENRYIFSGHRTDTAPFSRDADYNIGYHGDPNNGDIRIVIGESMDMRINSNEQDIFLDGVNEFNVLRDLKDGMESDDTAAISDQIELLDDALDQILAARADVGVKLNRLESTENHWANFKLSIEEMLFETEDVDFTRAMADLMIREVAYEASLAATASIVQPSLIQFLR